MIRFIDGYVSPLIFQNVARLHPTTAHEMNQWISAVSVYTTFVGVWLVYILVVTDVIKNWTEYVL